MDEETGWLTLSIAALALSRTEKLRTLRILAQVLFALAFLNAAVLACRRLF